MAEELESGALFSDSLLEEGSLPFRGLLASAGVHLFLVPMLAFGFQHAVRRLPDTLKANAADAEREFRMVTLKLPPELLKKPDPVKLPPQKQVVMVSPLRPQALPAPPKLAPVQPDLTARGAASAAAAMLPTTPKPARPTPKDFVPPPVQVQTMAQVVILQPPSVRTQETKLTDVALPSITMISPAPKPPHRTFDVGSLQKQRSMPEIPKPGTLPEPPSMVAADRTARPQATVVNPKLVIHAGPPPLDSVRAPDRGPMSAGGPVVQNPGNLVMSSARPVPAPETLQVPEVIIRGGPAPVAGTPGGTPGGSGPAKPGPVSSQPASSGRGLQAGTLTGSGAGTGFTGERPLIRIVHPATGRPDVTIVHSGVEQILPEARELLRGDPIYTVYINAGWPREWILHYCIPRNGPPPKPQVGGVVTLGAAPEVRPPYALTTEVPEAPAPTGKRERLLFHGSLDAVGRLQGMKQRGTDPNGVGGRILKALERWDWRPASLDGRAVEVQVILLAPIG